jgi:hypothetical protein
MTVNDDPFVWFYYIYGFTILPVMGFLWIFNRLNRSPSVVGNEWGAAAAWVHPAV